MGWEELWSSVCIFIWSNPIHVMDSPVVLISDTLLSFIGMQAILKEGHVANAEAVSAMTSSVVTSWAGVRLRCHKAIIMRETALSRFPRSGLCSICVVMSAMELVSLRC